MMTQSLVQDSSATSQQIRSNDFVFMVCQHGAEPTIKAQLLGPKSHFRLAFSRPGLLTFKCAVQIDDPLAEPTCDLPTGAFIRQSGQGLGNVRGSSAEELVDQTLELAGKDWDAIHVFQRDRGIPGLNGFEPGPNELTEAVGDIFRSRFESLAQKPMVNVECQPGMKVLDIVIVEPDQWLIGFHIAHQRHQCGVGGVFPTPLPSEMISRAYLKMGEALSWSGLPIRAGDRIVEIGSSPGGSCQRLLDVGLSVTGIDPAEMDPMLLEHPRFEHFRSKASGVKRRFFSRFKWLAADANVAPNYTLDFVEEIVNYPTTRLRGLLLTFKLSSYDLTQHFQQYRERIRSWGFDRVEIRQLATNRRECCVVAERPKGWKPPKIAPKPQSKS